jgi:hypothetical protein
MRDEIERLKEKAAETLAFARSNPQSPEAREAAVVAGRELSDALVKADALPRPKGRGSRAGRLQFAILYAGRPR